MTEWVPGPLYVYCDPENPGEGGTIASIDYVYDGKHRPAAIALIITHDRTQAERWRSAFAAGGGPNLKTDPPIHYPISDEVLEECIRSLREAGDL
jgi:hypothetical protein